MFREGKAPQVQPLKNVGVLIHLAYPVMRLVLRVGTDLELDYRVNRDIRSDMRRITQKPCQTLLLSRP